MKRLIKVMSEQAHVCLVVFVFVASRIFYYFYFGVRFDSSPLNYFLQYIDTKLLRDNLLQSIYFLHSTPPLYNMFLGVVLKLFPGSYSAVLWLVSLATGIVFSLALFLLMKALGIRPVVSAALTCLFCVSPLVVDYENWLFYEYPTAALLTGAALFLHRFIIHKKTADCFIFFLLLALVIYIRGLFNIYWFLAVLTLLLACNPARWSSIIRGCVFPLLLLLALFLKQYAVFGVFSIDHANAGQNLAVTVIGALPDDTVNALIAEGKISGLSRCGVFPRLSRYDPYGIKRAPTGIPVLDQRVRSSNWLNANNLVYLDVGRRDLADAIYVLKHYPGIVLRDRLKVMLQRYFLTSDQAAPFIADRTPRWIAWREFHKRYLLGADVSGKSMFLTVGLPFLLLYGIFFIIRSFILQGGQRQALTVVAFMIFTIMYLFVATAFVIHDRSRYRFLVDPFYAVLCGLCLNDVVSVVASWGRSGRRAYEH